MGYKKGYAFSPFMIPETAKRRKYVLDNGMVAVWKDTGEENDILTRRMQTYDPARFIKMYVGCYILFKTMRLPGFRMLYYIFQNLGVMKNYLYIDAKDAAKQLGFTSTRHVYNGINELIKHGVLGRKEGDSEYWINTMMFFNGKRKEFK